MKLIDGSRCRAGYRGTAGRGCPIQKLDYSLKKKGMKKMKKETWKTILQVIVTVLTALCTSLGVTSCM